MTGRRFIEVFTAGCYICNEVVEKIKDLECSNCEVKIYDLNTKCESEVTDSKAKEYGIKSVPAVVINGKLADCCSNRGIDIEAIKAACSE